jgi:hypothetical protein
MHYWIEVSSGDWAWVEKIQYKTLEEKRGLKAPARKKYLNMFEKISSGDILFTYLTVSLTHNKKWQGSLVGASKIAGSINQTGNTLRIDTSDDLELPEPIKFSDFKTLNGFSPIFKKAIRMRMQSYIFEIEYKDVMILLKLHQKNHEFLTKFLLK